MRYLSWIFATLMAGQAMADTVFDDFSGDAGARWDFVADRVMGGVSTGRAEIIGTGEAARLRLTGQVSTENNGGFIQARRRFDDAWPAGAQGLALRIKGNGETYHVFLKPPDLSRVWYSYRATFTAPEVWDIVRLPFDAFGSSHDAMPQSFSVEDIRSLAIVAYGADFDADVSVDWIRVY
jgi:hypothetical protein